MNNAELGMNAQRIICKDYDLKPCKKAYRQFASTANFDIETQLIPVLKKVIRDLKYFPVECTTFKKSPNKGETYIPYNFVLENGKTLSIRTTKTSNKIAPRVVGQAGYEVLNSFFEDIIGFRLENQEQIRFAVYNHISEMLPIFIDYLFNSDYTVWIFPKDDKFDYVIFDNNSSVNIEYDPTNFTFTRALNEWRESITLKYKGFSIAEIQTHQNRTFKFRFILPKFFALLNKEKITNETIGISAEYAVCQKFNLKYPPSFDQRKSVEIVSEIKDVVDKAFLQLPNAIKHTGFDSGARAGRSKCSFDFILEGSKTLSLKTNKGKMVCPPEVGQPNDITFYHYFKDLIAEHLVDEVIFKNLVLNSADKMLPIYLEHLFESDYLLWLFKEDGKWDYKILEKDFGKNVIWIKDDITFTRPTVEDWNESNTIKYKGKRIGEFQFHHHRNCFKFRFDFANLIQFINEVIEHGDVED